MYPGSIYAGQDPDVPTRTADRVMGAAEEAAPEEKNEGEQNRAEWATAGSSSAAAPLLRKETASGNPATGN